jgi:hypothetical protein
LCADSEPMLRYYLMQVVVERCGRFLRDNQYTEQPLS